MGRIKKVLAIVLSLVMFVSVAPTVKKANSVKADNEFCILSPTENQLMAAGHFDIKWTEAAPEVKDYKLYVDDQLVVTTTETTYEYYTTKVKMFNTYVEAEYTNGETQRTETVSFAVTKKGICLDYNGMGGAKMDPAELNIGWYYNWAVAPFNDARYKEYEFVPMIWGASSANDIKNKVTGFVNKGYKYVLGFNEPEPWMQGQSNITVDTAYSQWSGFMNPNIYAGAPATVLWPNISGDWFKPFMEKINANPDLDVDFIPVHCYPQNNPGYKQMADWFLDEVIDKTWQLYHKPIWVTEFSTEGNNITEKGTAEFLVYVMKGLDEREYVERYSFFSFNAATFKGGLWNYNTGKLSDVGWVYSYYGNPEGYEPTPAPETDYNVTTNEKKTPYDDVINVNNVACNNYIKEDGVTVEASSENGGNTAQKAIDGIVDKNTSRWESQHGIDPQTFTIDLGAIHNIKQINVLWEDAGAKDYYVEVSADGINYTKVAEAEGLNNMNYRNDTILLTKMTSARYIKITGTARATRYGYSIIELAVYGTDDVKVDETTKPEPTTRPTLIVPPPTDAPEEATTEKYGSRETTAQAAETTTKAANSPTAQTVSVGKTKVKKATKKKSSKKAKISLKKISGARGYQIRVYKSRSAKKVLLKKTVKKTNFTLKNKKLKNKKKLYIKARAYKVVNGIKYKGKWSNIKNIKITK